MASKKSNGNGQSLEQALAVLLNTQANFLRHVQDSDARNSERFARIESLLLDHSRILAEHTRILRSLPDAVREKIGFKPTPPGG